MPERIGRWLLLLGALGLALLGQFYFARKPGYVYDGIVFYGLAVVMFLALLRPAPLEKPSPRRRTLRFSAETLVRGVPILAGLLLGLTAVLQLTDQRDDYWPIFWTWTAAAALYMIGFVPWPFGGRAGERGSALLSTGGGAAEPLAAGSGTGRSVETAGGMPGYVGAQLASTASLRMGAPTALTLPAATTAAPSRPVSATRSWTAGSSVARLWEPVAVAVIVLAALVLRGWRVATIPWTLGGDEGSQGLWARAVIEGTVKDMFGLGWLSVPNMSFFFQAGWFRMLGDSVLGLRLPWAIVGTATVLGAYLLVRRLFGRPAALLTAVLLAAYHFHIHFSRLGSNQIADPLFMVWALYLLVIGVEAGGSAGKRWAWAGMGMLAGLSFYFYAGARQAPVILLAVLAYAVLLDRSFWRRHKVDMLVMLGGFLVVFGPMGLIALQHPAEFNARLNQVGIFQSGWIDRAAAATGRSRLSILIDQVQQAFLAFNLYRDRVSWYGASIPLMDFAASIFFVLGAAFSVSRMLPGVDRRESGGNEGNRGNKGNAETSVPLFPLFPSIAPFPGWRYAIFVIWFVAVIGLGGALTENPPSSQRLVSSAVPAIFFVAIALLALARVLGDLLGWGRLDRAALAATLAAALALISVRYYFGPYQQSWAYGNTNAEVATRIGYYLQDLGPGWQEYFFGVPRMYADFGSTPFIARGVSLRDVPQPLSAPFSPAGLHNVVFVFLPERSGELEWVRQAYPEGTVEKVHRIGQPAGPLLFIAYRVD